MGYNEEWLQRTEILTGKERLERLKSAHVLVVGLGGVGAYAAEQICRAGVGKMTIVDGDKINVTNSNRQLLSMKSTLGKLKAEVMADRLKNINPELDLKCIPEFIRDERMKEILKEAQYDYVIDAIDTLSPKIYLICHSLNLGLNIVSSMGTGGKYDPSLVEVSDISKSYNCKLARMLRKKLHQLGIRTGFKVVFSPEVVSKQAVYLTEGEQNKKSNVGTISYMPPVFGCFCASVAIQHMIGKNI